MSALPITNTDHATTESRVPWPGNSWMPFTSQPALLVFQQPHKHSHSLQLATYTELAHHYIQNALSTLSVFFSPRGFLRSTAQPHQSTAKPLERAPNPIKVTRPSSLFIPVAAMGECKQINKSNLLYVSDVISLIIHERITRFC